MKFNFKIILSLLGLLLSLNGVFMLLCLPFSIYYQEEWHYFMISSGITIGIGFPLWLYFNSREGSKELKRKDGYLVVTLVWLVMSFSGSLPYYISGEIPSFTNAFFETMSGYTTTGSTILDNIEALPKGLLFWRSLTQWIGGMGIIVLAVAILPLLGIGGMQLFVAEAPGISPDKLKPRIKETAKRLWLIYLGLTVVEAILLKIGGMGYFDAINHALTTLASGGFSTKQQSIAYFQTPFIQYVIIIFMAIAGTNFTLIYFVIKGKMKKVFSNEEFKYYVLLVVIFTLIGFSTLAIITNDSIELTFRKSLFQVVSIITTTGYTIADYTTWGTLLTFLFFIMMFIGASAGSTAGGVKIVRHVILFKNSFLEMKRLLHPSAIIPVRFNNKAISQDITFNVLAFIMIYILVFTIGALIMSLIGVDFTTAVGSVASTLGNVGPGIGNVSPSYSFSAIPTVGKWFLAFLMLLGRLELFTIMILLTPYFWRKL